MTTTHTPSRHNPGAVLERTEQYLETQQVQQALEVLEACGQISAAIRNATGVCLLRLGRYEAAASVFRDLVFPQGAFTVPDNTPTAFRANYATALLLQGNLTIGLTALNEIPDRQHPGVHRLAHAVRQWKRSLPWWRRALLLIGVCPPQPFRVAFLPGQLWKPGEDPARRAA